MHYCKQHFEECIYYFIFDYDLLKRMFGFAGWNMIGTASAILRNQGGDILINLFFGPAVNAAKAIATHVNAAIDGFVQNFMIAMNPQITKSYANGNHNYMLDLVMKGSKFSYFILLLIGMPVLLNTDYILQLWLKIVPSHAVLFVQLTIILTMCDSLSHTLVAAILAEGEIKTYMIVVGGLQLLNIPVAYIALLLGGVPEVIVIVAIIISQICLATRLFFLKQKVNLSIGAFISKVYGKVIIVTLLASLIPLCLQHYLHKGLLSFITVSISAIGSTAFFVYSTGLSKDEREMLLMKIKEVVYKYK